MAKHCTDITLTPEGKTYRLSGEWDLLGVRSDGAGGPACTTRRIEFQVSWRPDRAAAWIKANELLREAHAFQQVGVAGV